MDINKDYPYIQKQLAEELGVRPYDVQLIIWKYGLKKDKKYSILVETSQSGKVYMYTKYALEFLKEILEINQEGISPLRPVATGMNVREGMPFSFICNKYVEGDVILLANK